MYDTLTTSKYHKVLNVAEFPKPYTIVLMHIPTIFNTHATTICHKNLYHKPNYKRTYTKDPEYNALALLN